MTKLAIIDIGTNSIHMVLAEVEPDFSYKILDRFKDMTRLGDGVFKTGRLSETAMVRGLEVLRSLTTLARNKGYERIVVEGHTDSLGVEAYNLDLSRRRAQSVAKYLTEKFKIAPDKVFSMGFGQSQPIADNGNYQGRKQNRRVEIKVWKEKP